MFPLFYLQFTIKILFYLELNERSLLIYAYTRFLKYFEFYFLLLELSLFI